MANDFFTYFSSTPLSRVQIYNRLAVHLSSAGMRFSGECMRLNWHDSAKEYVFSYEESSYHDAREALTCTDSWPGVMLEYDSPVGDRSIYLWDDEAHSGQTFGFEDTSGLFFRLWEDHESQLRFAEFVANLAECLHSPFAITASYLPRKTATVGSFLDLIKNLPSNAETVRPTLIAIHGKLSVGNIALAGLSKHFRRADFGHYLLFTDQRTV